MEMAEGDSLAIRSNKKLFTPFCDGHLSNLTINQSLL